MVTRRDFLKKSAIASTLSIVPSSFIFGQRATSGGLPPSERVNVAVVGIGGQGHANVNSFINTGLCNIVALCDVDLSGKPAAHSIQKCPDAKQYTDFRKMFDVMADEIDAVLIATPDHSHFSVSMLAMSLGKHVYVQKPLAHTYGQCARLIHMARRSGVVTQMGNQGHSGPNYFQFKAWSEAGLMKDITRVTAFMNKDRRWHGWGASVKKYPKERMPRDINWEVWMDSAPEHPYSAKLHPGEWRSWFDYGSGAFGDWGPHLLDTTHRFLKLGLPKKITAVKREGENKLVYPQESTIEFKFPAREGMPACEVTWYDGKANIPEVEDELGLQLKKPGKILYGKDLTFKGDSHGTPLQIVPREKFMEMRASLPRFPQKNSNHFKNFLLACKGEEEARSPFSVSGPLCQVFNLGIIAQRMGGVIEFDSKYQRIVNNNAAQALIDPAPRKGWEEFYRL